MESPVTVCVAASLAEALLLKGLLETEGVVATVPGSELMDEFAVARQARGALDVVVAGADEARARDIVAAWRERGAQEGASDEG